VVAISSMIRKPLAFKTWLDYHISLGIKHFFLRIEDTPELSELLNQYSGIVTCEYDNQVNKIDNYWTQMDRQKMFVDKSIISCNKLGIKWLAHIDSDELICSNNLNFLDHISDDYQCVVISNYEAVYPNDSIQDPFLGTDKFLYENRLAYCNGKSIGRVSKDLVLVGPHRFNGKEIEINEALILHYESPNFEKWYDKFTAEKNDTQDVKLDTIPFKFYKESIQIIKSRNVDQIKNYYYEMKVKPYYESFSQQLFWTPMNPQKNIFWKKSYGKFQNSLYN
jgi:hypothetical protein